MQLLTRDTVGEAVRAGVEPVGPIGLARVTGTASVEQAVTRRLALGLRAEGTLLRLRTASTLTEARRTVTATLALRAGSEPR